MTLWHHRTVLLNTPDWYYTALIMTYVQTWERSDGSTAHEATLHLRDCYRTVVYEIGLGEDERVNTFFKLDTMISELIRFREVCRQAVKEIDAGSS